MALKFAILLLSCLTCLGQQFNYGSVLMRPVPSGGGGPWSIVHTATNSNASGGVTSLAVQSATVGNTMIVLVGLSPQTVSVSSMSDNGATGGNSYSHAGANYRATDTGSTWGVEIWYAPITKTCTSISLTPSTAGDIFYVFAYEVSGLAASPFETSAALNNQTDTGNPAGAQVTTSNAGDFIVAICGQTHTINGVSAGWTLTADAVNGIGNARITSTGAAAGNWQPTFTDTASGNYATVTAAFHK